MTTKIRPTTNEGTDKETDNEQTNGRKTVLYI